MKLRWYQEEARDSIWSYFADGGEGNPVIGLPTGTGKSIVIGDFIKQVVTHYPNERILKLTHVKELISQNFAKLLELWPLAPAGIYSAGLDRREHAYPITYCGIASVAGKAALFGRVDLVLIDECHLLGPKEGSMYRKFLGALRQRNPALKVVGFTATPFRVGQGRITDPGGIFTDICYDLTNFEGFNRLIADGFLCPLVPKRSKENTLDVSAVSTVGGEYNQHELQAAVDRDAITDAAIEETLQLAGDRKHWLVFAAGIVHSNHIADSLNGKGISAVSIHSKMGDDARDAAIRDWKAGKIQAAVNNNILTTGIDFPGIDLIVHLRPTRSPGLWVQSLGRGTRPFPGKVNCLVLDFAGNTARLGPINDPVLPRPRGKKGKGAAPVKLCPHCDTWNHASVNFCCSCGAEFARPVKISDEASELELLAGEGPMVETFPVFDVSYDCHIPKWHDKPPSLKVTYYCGPRHFYEWVSLENPKGLVRHRARSWWRARSLASDVPETVAEAYDRCDELAKPTHIQVWLNKKYPDVLAADFTGKGFV